MIVNVLRLRPGVPVTLAAFCVDDYRTGSSPKLWGFPDYEVNNLRASDFKKGNYYYDDESRKHKKKPNNHYYGGNYYGQSNLYNNYHHANHHYVHQQSYYTKPAPIITTTTEKPTDDYYKIISTYTAVVDEKCDRAFVIDVGVLNYYGNNTNVIQNPALLVYDLQSDCCETRNFPLIRRTEFPDKVIGSIPFGILFFELDFQSNDCNDLFIYISNAFENKIIVHDYKKNDFWEFTDHPTFQPVIAQSHMVFDKTFFYSMPLGIVSFALDYTDKYGDRTAYYFPGSSTAQFAVSTKVLKDKRKAPTNYDPDDFRIMGYRDCDSQATDMTVDYTYGVIFYLEMQSNKVRCWNMNKPLNPDNIGVVYDSPEKLLYGTQIFIDSRGYLWFNSGHLPIIFLSDDPLDTQQVNTRIFRIKVSDAIRGTVCEDEDSYRLGDLYNGYEY